MFYLLPIRRRVALDNLTIAFADTLSKNKKKKIAKQAFEHMAISFMEIFRISKILEGDIKEIFTIKGLEHFEKALERKKGILFVVSHVGAWEYLAFLFYLTGYRCSVPVKEIRNSYIFDWLNAMRQRTTLNVISKLDPRAALKTVFYELAQNNVVALLIDQWAGNNEPWVDFFGKPASTTAMPARLAIKTGCALVPGACIRKSPGKYEITIFPEVPVDADSDDALAVTKRLNQSLEVQVRDNPEQWIWAHKRWKDKKIYA